MSNIETSRRRFLIGAAAGAAVMAGEAVAAKPAADTPKFDKVYDIIVVGSGFAGLAAALEARLGGAEVLLIEKMPAFGGNSAINGGAFSVAGRRFKRRPGSRIRPSRCWPT